MNASINNSDFLEKQVEKLEKFMGTTAPEKNDVVKDVEDYINGKAKVNESKPLESLSKDSEALKSESTEEESEEKVVIEPVLEKVNLDNNKPKVSKKEKEEDAELKAHLEWLDSVDESEKGKVETVASSNNDEIEKYKTKATEYEELTKDGLTSAFIEWRKSGGDDINDFIKSIGVVDVNKLSIEDFYKQKATEAGLSGDEAKEAIEEAVEKYRGLSKIEQIEVLNNYKKDLRNRTEEKLKSFSANSQKSRVEEELIQKAAFDEIKKRSNELVGKKWRGLLIDEKMSKEIQNSAADYSLPKYENGVFVGYDIEKGIKMAIYDKFEKKLLKAQQNLTKVQVYDELINERNRPSENLSGNQIVVAPKNDIERVTKEWREDRKKTSGLLKK